MCSISDVATGRPARTTHIRKRRCVYAGADNVGTCSSRRADGTGVVNIVAQHEQRSLMRNHVKDTPALIVVCGFILRNDGSSRIPYVRVPLP